MSTTKRGFTLSCPANIVGQDYSNEEEAQPDKEYEGATANFEPLLVVVRVKLCH